MMMMMILIIIVPLSPRRSEQATRPCGLRDSAYSLAGGEVSRGAPRTEIPHAQPAAAVPRDASPRDTLARAPRSRRVPTLPPGPDSLRTSLLSPPLTSAARRASRIPHQPAKSSACPPSPPRAPRDRLRHWGARGPALPPAGAPEAGPAPGRVTRRNRGARKRRRPRGLKPPLPLPASVCILGIVVLCNQLARRALGVYYKSQDSVRPPGGRAGASRECVSPTGPGNSPRLTLVFCSDPGCWPARLC